MSPADRANFIFHLNMKTTEIFKYILPFTGDKLGLGWGTNYQAMGRY